MAKTGKKLGRRAIQDYMRDTNLVHATNHDLEEGTKH
jgi:hypothetical protein